MNTLIDIGCNTLGGYKHLQNFEDIARDDIHKIFVEPNPECWDVIEQKLINIPNSVLVKKAINSVNGVTELITRSDVEADIAATIIGQKYLEAQLAKCNMFVDQFNTYQIECITIKQLINNFDIVPQNTILKLDAEGIEYELLESILFDNICFHKIYCEFHILNNDDAIRKNNILSEFLDRGISIIDWQ